MTTPKLDSESRESVDRYLDLLARTLTRYEIDSPYRAADPSRLRPVVRKLWNLTQRTLQRKGITLVRAATWDYRDRLEGKDWPAEAETMVGLARLANLRQCLEVIIAENVPGDLLEAGVWRGGASIFMRGVLVAHGVSDRIVWLADSFQGLPAPDTDQYPQDANLALQEFSYLAASQLQVQQNFVRYDLMDDEHVRFLPGWFKDTMPSLPMTRLALLRVDGDMYESTIQVLEGAFDKVALGGFVVIDDYKSFPECKQATDDFRARRGITDPIVDIDWTGVYWRKSA